MIIPRSFFFISIAVLFSVAGSLKAQKGNPLDQFYKFANYYSKGDIINAENCLISLAEQKDQLSEEYLIALYNNFGVINNLLGRYDEALKYLNQAESIIGFDKQPSPELANIYLNKARIYGIIKEPDKAIDYLEQGIKIYLSIKKTDQATLLSLSAAYLNLGLTYFEKNDYSNALLYLEKSLDLKIKNKLSNIALPYLNIAKTYVKINNREKAQKYFLECIESFNREFGKDYYRTSSVLFDYGLFLRSIGKSSEALEIHRKALAICLKNYGEKHTFVSLAYKLLGDHFFIQADYRTALQYYQKSLIAVVSGFNGTDIYSNPPLDSVLFDIRLLENLKRKAQALEMLSLQQEGNAGRQGAMVKSFETIELALQLIARIRSGYVSADSRIYLAENEKETYLFAAHTAQELYELTQKPEFLERMYAITCLSKSAVLRNEIAENSLIKRGGLSDSLSERQNRLQVNIASYSKLIQDELQKAKPETQKIDFWKTELFGLNRTGERLSEKIKLQFPQLESLIQKTEPTSLSEIQSHLKKDETLVEYFISNQYSKGKRELFIFTITKNGLEYRLTQLDSLFTHRVEAIKGGTSNSSAVSYQQYTDALHYMYEQLVKPIEARFAGSKLIIVPDEEIAYLPFDAFIRQRPAAHQTGYDGLQYLIYDYTISYGYTSWLIYPKSRADLGNKVYSFSPDYGGGIGGSGNGYSMLRGTGREIGSIYKRFNGEAFTGGKAAESSFKRLARQPGIFHLAMHSQTDPKNSSYSYLVFDNQSDTIDDGKLFSYEISMSRLESPMVVLSACNTGTGDLYHGEGVMSLTRSFILAGASSVVSTFWDVNDDASASIMTDFYSNLSEGDDKGEALRKAKLSYLRDTPPTYTNPFYWAAYEVIGDKTPIKRGSIAYLFYSGALIAIIGIIYLTYRRFRRY